MQSVIDMDSVGDDVMSARCTGADITSSPTEFISITDCIYGHNTVLPKNSTTK